MIDAKSGTTGAGKKAAEHLLFAEVAEECLPYRVGKHQHTPEIQEVVEKVTGQKIEPHFTTSLLSAKRGIIAGVYALAKTTQIEDVAAAYNDAYSTTACSPWC